LLYFNNNNLSSLPTIIGNLTSLEKLNFDENKLSSLPTTIGNLTSLVELNLGNNNFTEKCKQLLKISRLSERFAEIFAYYQKSTQNLAVQYVADSLSLTSDEVDRLIHEADHHIRQILEQSLPNDDPVVLKINKRMRIELNKDYKIML